MKHGCSSVGIQPALLAILFTVALAACTHLESVGRNTASQVHAKEQASDTRDETREVADRMAMEEGARIGFTPVFVERREREEDIRFVYRMRFLDRRVMNPDVVTVIFNKKTKAYSFAAHS